MSDIKTMIVSGTELDAVIAEHLADGWRLVGQSTLGASEFELVFVREPEVEP